MNVGFKIPSTVVDTEPLRERTFDLRQYLNFLWRNWMFIVSVAALVFLMGLVHLVRAIPLYTASTQVLLERREQAPGLNAVVNDGRFEDSYSYVENQLAILRSDSLLRRVVIKEQLARPNTKESQAAAQNKDEPASVVRGIIDGINSLYAYVENQLAILWSGSVLRRVDIKEHPAPPSTNQDDSASAQRAIVDGINRLRGALGVSRSGQAQILNIAITWDDPVRAAQLANAVADAFVVDQLDARLESAKRASGWLSDRLVELRRQLSDSEEAVAKFRKEHRLTRSGATVALNDQQLAELNSKLIAARSDAAEKKARVDFLDDLAAGKKTLESLPDSLVSGTSLMGTLRGKLADASQREADLLARYNIRHPAVVNAEAEKRDIEHSIAVETQRMAQAVRSDYALAKARLDAMEQSMREATGQGELDNDDVVKLRELERTAAVNKTLFEEFLQKAKITDEQSTFQARDVRVIMPAQPGGQSSPNTRRILLIVLFVGLGLGVSGAFAKETLKSGFTTPREVEEALGIPVLASVGRMKKRKLVKNGKSVPVPFYQMHYPLSPFSEAIRTLRSSIHMSDVDHPPKVIHVTSARPAEGKTTIAVSLAISAASAGLKVVLLDADLRHPAASRLFKLEQEKGLVDLLIGATTADDVSTFYKDLKLTVIPAGSKSLNPPDVLGSERMKALISRLRETFDYVVLDTPPVGPVVDSVIVANLADKTIFAIQWASTPRELIETSIQQLSTHKRVAGVVFNSVNYARSKKYGSPYFYGKSYEKYYSE
jgi:succinoglycan biosynthesis transport protein ExoP